MDNSNNPNWPNNPSPFPGNTPPAPVPDPMQPQPANPMANGDIAAPSPWDAPVQQSSSQPENPAPIQSEPTAPVNPAINPWDISPAAALPAAPTPGWPPVEQSQPQPNPIQPSPTPSPLDNPWGVPIQPPSIDSASPPAPQPTWIPTPGSSNGINSNTPNPAQAEPAPVQPEPALIEPESAPTDLSHLISNNSQTDVNQTSVQNPATLVVPSASPEVSATAPAENHKSIPKWLIGIGVGLLVIVSGASAYFILGIGQAPKTQSVPAVQETTSATIKAATPIATPPAASSQTASESANFGQLGGNAPASPPPQASSAADLLRQRK